MNILDIIISDNNRSSLHDDTFVIIGFYGYKGIKQESGLHTNGMQGHYLKIHLASDIRKKRILSTHVTSDKIHDGKVLPKLVDGITIKQNEQVDTVIADGAYDSNKNF